MRRSQYSRLVLITGSLAITCFLMLGAAWIMSDAPAALAGAVTAPDLVATPVTATTVDAPQPLLGCDVPHVEGLSPFGPLSLLSTESAEQNLPATNCSAPIIVHGSIITGTSPTFAGRLIRNGVESTCNDAYTCSGTQNLTTPFSYDKQLFLNNSPNWQCVAVDVDARSCTQQLYSAAYLGSFSPISLCANIQGAMGFSTSGLFGYTFMAPPNTPFSIVNNTTGVVPPSSDCANYTMTVTLCSAQPAMAVDIGQGLGTVFANSLGQVMLQVPVSIRNTGDFAGSIDASTAVQTTTVSVRDNQPAAVQADLAIPGGIVMPGDTVTQTISLRFSGSQFQCLPRDYMISNDLSMTAKAYSCNGYNPPSAVVFSGAVLPDDSFDEDAYAFESREGTMITVTVDTISAATAFDIEACLSATPTGPCLLGLSGDDDFSCTFPPPSFGCPRFGGLLPADTDGDNIYYIRVNSGSGATNFAGPQGNYRGTLLVTAGPIGACPTVASLDNGMNSFLRLLSAASPRSIAPPANTLYATVALIHIRVPPSDPANPSCGLVYLPLAEKQ